MRVLIATDGSRYSDIAIRAAASRPWPAGSEVRVITVLEHPTISYITAGELMASGVISVAERDATAALAERAAAVLDSMQLRVSHVMREGSPAEMIIDEAKDWRADLIIVGTHGRRGISRFLLGSVAQRVAMHAPCSVEIVRKPDDDSTV